MIHQVASTLHKEVGGVDVAVREIIRGLIKQGYGFKAHALTLPPADSGLGNVTGYKPLGFAPRKLGYAPGMLRGIMRELREGDVVHNHGLWMMPNVYAGVAARRAGAKLLMSPHGTLSLKALAQSRLKKRAFLALGQRRVLTEADCFHATSEIEYSDIRERGYRQPVAMIPLGVSIPESMGGVKRSGKNFDVLFLARLHPNKGLESLLKVWSHFVETRPDARLTVAGPSHKGHAEKMEGLSKELGLDSVKFVGELTGDAKREAFFRSHLYVLPTEGENFGLTVAEALGHGVPVITTKGAPWSGLVARKCGWWIEKTEEGLLGALESAYGMSRPGLAEMGGRGRDWISREYSWDSVVIRLRELYAWMEEGAGRPEFVDI